MESDKHAQQVLEKISRSRKEVDKKVREESKHRQAQEESKHKQENEEESKVK